MPVMHSTDLWTTALAGALPVWEAAVRQSGWQPVAVAAAQAAVALLCLTARRCARRKGEASPAWTTATATLLLLAMNTLFAFDLLFIEWMRGVARASGWYDTRRGLQALALVSVGVAAVAAWGPLRHRLALAAPVSPWLLTGLAGLAALATLRLVSLHATDELIHTRLAGLTLGRLVDALGLGLVASGAWRGLRELRIARP